MGGISKLNNAFSRVTFAADDEKRKNYKETFNVLDALIKAPSPQSDFFRDKKLGQQPEEEAIPNYFTELQENLEPPIKP